MQLRKLWFKVASALPRCVKEHAVGIETFPLWEVASDVTRMELAWLDTICEFSPVSYSRESRDGMEHIVIRYLKSDADAFENVKGVLQNLYLAAKRKSESNTTLRYAVSAIERYAYSGNTSLLTDGLHIPGGKLYLLRPGLLGATGRTLSASDSDEDLYDKVSKMLGMAILEKYARYVREIVSGSYKTGNGYLELDDGTRLSVNEGKLLVTEPGCGSPHSGYENADIAPVIAALTGLVSKPPADYN